MNIGSMHGYLEASQLLSVLEPLLAGFQTFFLAQAGCLEQLATIFSHTLACTVQDGNS